MPLQQQYERVAEQLTKRILTGEFPPGAKLPSRKELAIYYKVSDTVIDKAMAILRRDGLTETLRGVGVYVKEPPPS